MHQMGSRAVGEEIKKTITHTWRHAHTHTHTLDGLPQVSRCVCGLSQMLSATCQLPFLLSSVVSDGRGGGSYDASLLLCFGITALVCQPGKQIIIFFFWSCSGWEFGMESYKVIFLGLHLKSIFFPNIL